MIEEEKFNIRVEFLTQKQIEEHLKLYSGYVKKINEIISKLQTADRTASNASYSDFRELMIEESFVLNAITLHEKYFENLGKKEINGEIKRLIAKDFESIEKWQEDFKACAMASRGWIILSEINGKLKNFICDSHNMQGIWNAKILLVLDVYEHAYFFDYQTNKKEYVEKFIEEINWNAVNERQR